MRHSFRFAVSAILSFVSVSCLHAQAFGKPPVSPTMPFELVGGFLVVVNAEIGDLSGLKFILDTGATHSLIDRKVADRLRLHRRSGDVISFDRHVDVEWADIPDLRVGPLRGEALRIMVVKLAEYSEFAEHADGIIGLDLLSKSRKFSIDYDGRTVLSNWQTMELLIVPPWHALSFHLSFRGFQSTWQSIPDWRASSFIRIGFASDYRK